jgi:hypothetical protein
MLLPAIHLRDVRVQLLVCTGFCKVASNSGKLAMREKKRTIQCNHDTISSLYTDLQGCPHLKAGKPPPLHKMACPADGTDGAVVSLAEGANVLRKIMS